MGVPVRACMVTPPARRPPNSTPARTVPTGLPRPSSATVMVTDAENRIISVNPAFTTFLDSMEGYGVITVQDLNTALAEIQPFLLDVRQPEDLPT